MQIAPGWTEEELAILKEKWLLGWTDEETGELLHRTSKAVQSKRRDLNLLAQFYPHRPDPRNRPSRASKSTTTYNDVDVLRRYNAGEEPKSIAASYGVSTRAMMCKIDRLLMHDDILLGEPTERRCLMCTRIFASPLPKSVNRRCGGCQRIINETGSSFL